MIDYYKEKYEKAIEEIREIREGERTESDHAYH